LSGFFFKNFVKIEEVIVPLVAPEQGAALHWCKNALCSVAPEGDLVFGEKARAVSIHLSGFFFKNFVKNEEVIVPLVAPEQGAALHWCKNALCSVAPEGDLVFGEKAELPFDFI
jgi:hypothetical protein